MSTHNIGFYEDLTKIIFELSSNIIKYAPYFFCCTSLQADQLLNFHYLNSTISLVSTVYKQSRIPYSLYLAQSALSFYKIALKMRGKIASQLLHSENKNCLP